MNAFRLPFLARFKEFSDAVAVKEGERDYRYARLGERVAQLTEELARKGVRRGTVAAVRADWSFEAVALFFALAEREAVAVPIVTRTPEEIRRRLEIAGCDLLLEEGREGFVSRRVEASGNKHPLLHKLKERGHAGLVLFSSGSTGEPKGMVHDLDRLIESYAKRGRKGFNTLVFLTYDHIGGIDTMLRALSSGGCLTIPASRDPEEVCAAIEKGGVEVLPASPTFMNLLLLSGADRRYDLSSLRIVAFGAEPMPEPLLRRLKERFGGVEFQQKFGTSETNAVRIRNDEDDPLFFRIDDPNTRYRIVDGELWLKSRTRVLGYLNAPEDSFDEEGWFRTGDLVEEDETGRLRIVGRLKEVINVGGEKVFPAEVEAVLQEMEEVADALVYGEPNPITGQSVAADIVPAVEIDRKEMKKAVRRYCRNRLAAYKIPGRIRLVDRTSFGERFKKIRRK